MVQDASGNVIQNAAVSVYQPGTTTAFTGSAFSAKTGGTVVTNPILTNAQGEAEAWFNTAQSIDIRVTDNAGAAFYPATPTSLLTFTAFTEANHDLEVAREDQPSSIGLAGDMASITAATQTALAGTTTRWADAGHRHPHTDVMSINPHGAADHTDITRSFFLPIHDGVVLDGGTLASRGTAPDIIRVITLADAAASGAAWAFTVPGDWASGALNISVLHAGQTTTTGTVRWSIDSENIAAGSSIAVAGTTAAFTGAAPTTIDLLVREAAQAGETPGVTGDLYRISVRRLGNDAADTYAASTSLIGIYITYTANQ